MAAWYAKVNCQLQHGLTCLWVKFTRQESEISPTRKEIMAREYFTWTDDETELLLSLTLEYKTEKSLENIDWESLRSKYNDIHERFVAHLQNIVEGTTPAPDKYSPHRPEEITTAVVTSKLKGIRGRYRKAVDSGRKSGHGRVVELYFTLCQEIWGGSPATEQISSGLESGDLLEEIHQIQVKIKWMLRKGSQQ